MPTLFATVHIRPAGSLAAHAMRDERTSHQLSIRPLESKEMERSLRAVLGSVGYGVLLTDLDHRSLVCNARFGDLFGIDPAAVVNSDVERVRAMVRNRIPDLVAWEHNLEQVYADSRREQSDELTLVNPHAVLNRNTRPVFDETGEVVGRIWTFWDVTSEARQRELDRTLGQISTLRDPDPTQTCQWIADQVSKVFQSVALISIQEGDFMRFHTISGIPEGMPELPGNPLATSYCQFCLASASLTTIQDARAEDHTRDMLPVQLGMTRYAGVPLHGQSGEIVGTICIMDGRSDERLTESELRFLSLVALRIEAELMRESHLKALMQDLEFTSEQLSHVQRKLIQSEKLAITGTLAASVAHDIRNILASMQLQIEMGESQPQAALNYVSGSLSRFEVLAHRLMSYAKPRATATHRVDLNDVIQNVVQLIEPQFKVKSVSLRVVPSPEPATLEGDDGRLEHLFVNLAINALSVSPRGSQVSLEVDARGVSVCDQGPGINPEVATTLFEPFVSTRKDGFGLGLYSCREIAKEHGATLSVSPNDGGGSRFRFELGASE